MSPTPPETSKKPRRATDVPYITLFPSSSPDNTQNSDSTTTTPQNKYVHIHPSSVLSHQSPDSLPTYLIYSHLSLASPSTISSNKLPKTRLHPLTSVTSAQLVALAEGTPLLDEGKPVGKVEVLERDEGGRERRACFVVPFLRPGNGDAGVGWPLPPARRRVQARVLGRGWVGEEVAG